MRQGDLIQTEGGPDFVDQRVRLQRCRQFCCDHFAVCVIQVVDEKYLDSKATEQQCPKVDWNFANAI